MKAQILLLITIGFTGVVFGQAFQKTIYNPEKDFNHYSIDNTKNGYVCVGTLFGEENNDIHIVSLDHNGNVLWEQTIDESKDDRGLDVLVDPKENIVLTGYISPKGEGSSNLYVAKMDLNGNYIGDRSLVHAPPTWGFELMSTGTKIIYSEKTESYIVGGLLTRRMERPLTYNYALLVSFDYDLNLIDQNRIFTGSDYQSINDIVEVPDGYFITGGIDRGGSRQGVLAAIVDYNLDLTKNFSFDDIEGGKHIGVSLVYDEKADDMYLMSNNSAANNPQITRFGNISNELSWCTTDILSNSYLLILDDKGYFDPAGYKLEPCLWNDDHLIASGYFKKKSSAFGPSGTIAWIVEFDKITGNPISSMEWTISPANGFPAQGGVLSEFRFRSPLYYTQEMMTQRNDEKGYVMIAPRLIDGKYSLELMTTEYSDVVSCFKEIKFETKSIDIIHGCIDQGNIRFEQYQPKIYPKKADNKQDVFCEKVTALTSAQALSITEVQELVGLSIYPNPANERLSIQLPNGADKGAIEVIDLTGKVILQDVVNATNIALNIAMLENGIYFVKYTAPNGEVYKSKFVKSN